MDYLFVLFKEIWEIVLLTQDWASVSVHSLPSPCSIKFSQYTSCLSEIFSLLLHISVSLTYGSGVVELENAYKANGSARIMDCVIT